MSAAQHQHAAQRDATAADGHDREASPDAEVERTRCSPKGRTEGEAGDGCWTSVTNPTAAHARAAADHRRQAADHRAASAALGVAEGRACAGIRPADRDASPFVHVEDIVSVEPLIEPTGTVKVPSPRTAGAVVTFRAVPGMTAAWLQQVVDCHLARNASLGHEVPEMPACPLVPHGAEARVTSTGDGFAVAVRANGDEESRQILARAQMLGVSASK